MKKLKGRPSDLPTMMDVSDVAALYGVSEWVARSWFRSGKLPATKTGRSWFIPRDRLLEAMNGGRHDD